MSNKTVACNACGEMIEISDKIMRNRLSEDVLYTFFQCPHCEAAFLISATDAEFRKLLAQRARGMNKNKKGVYIDQETVRQLSEKQKLKYTPRFKELIPTAYTKEDTE